MVFAVVIALHAIGGGVFLLDDNPSILENHSLLKSLPEALQSSNFRYLTYALNWANLQVFGYSAQAFHMTNVALHIIVSLMLFFLVRLFTETDQTAAALAAAWFALNPAINMSVLYISARSTILATIWTIAAISAYLKFEREGRAHWLIAALLASVAAMLSKENGIAAPALIIAMGLISSDKRRWAIAAILMLAASLSFVTLRLRQFIYLGPESATPTSFEYFLTQMTVIPRYLLQLMWPVGIALEQHAPIRTGLLDPAVIAGAVGMAVVWCYALWRLRASKAAVFFLVWLPITFAPESSIVPFIDTIFLHRVYMPAAGLAALVAYALLVPARAETGFRGKRVVLAASGVLMVCFALFDVSTSLVWKTEIGVRRQSVRVSPDKFRTRYDFGVELIRELQYRAARPHLESAVLIGDPTAVRRARAWNALGKVRYRLGDFSGAAECFIAASRENPIWNDPFLNAGLTLLRIEKPAEALEYLERAAALGLQSEQLISATNRARKAVQTLQPDGGSDTISP